MQRPWLVYNPASGSTTADAGDAVTAALAAAGAPPVGVTHFPAERSPSIAELREARADALVVMGGDGTVNAVTTELDDWDGCCLVLPGGTMNVLAKALHGTADWEKALAAAPGAPADHLPCAFVGEHRALVGLIVGPAAAWVHARERVRAGQLAGLARAFVFAWRKTWRRTVRVQGEGRRGHRAVVVTPHADDLEIASIDAAGWFGVARIGWSWIAGDWRDAPNVHVRRAPSVRIIGRNRVSVLVDGELSKVPGPVEVRHGATRLRYIQTRRPPELEAADGPDPA